MRDLCRAREDAHEDLVRCRHRLSKMLLAPGLDLERQARRPGARGTGWLRSLRFEQPADQVVFDNYLLAIEQVEQRLRGLEQHIEALSRTAAYAEAVAALRCFRGIDTLTAMGLVAELHDFMRFDSARGLMAFLGLVPSEYSSGRHASARGDHQGRQPPCRAALLIEAAWHYRHRPERQELGSAATGQPARGRSRSPTRPCIASTGASTSMLADGKPTPKTVVAVARELVGFIWVALQPEGRLRRGHQTLTLDITRSAGGRSRRMKAGTIRRTRVAALRQGGSASRTRDVRQRRLPTENGHAALRSGATRAYQNDSSSKRPAFSVVSGPQGG